MASVRRVVLFAAVLFCLIVLGAACWWAFTITRDIRELRADIPSDPSYEISELRDQVEALSRRVDEVESAIADADANATEAQEAVDELRDDVIALGLALSR